MSQNHIADTLIRWYHEYSRDLPWRNTTDPYRIWISEIILQQTRVAQGLDYFNRFIDRFPTVATLAEATEEEVMRYWQGLGYYSRARNLHAAARDVMDRFGGRFPKSYEEALSLKGIGEYTAAAVCSFAYRLPCAVVDGNVYRVLSRLLGISTPIDTPKGKKEFAEAARLLLDTGQPDLYNQAIMDFGAMQCTPRSPRCTDCPLAGQCTAYALNQIENFPVKQGKTVVKPRYFHYLCIVCNDRIWITQRTGNDIWKNLFEFPLAEGDRELTLAEIAKTETYRQLLGEADEVSLAGEPYRVKHILSHRIIHATFCELHIGRATKPLHDLIETDWTGLDEYAISRLTQLFLEQRKIEPQMPFTDRMSNEPEPAKKKPDGANNK